ESDQPPEDALRRQTTRRDRPLAMCAGVRHQFRKSRDSCRSRRRRRAARKPVFAATAWSAPTEAENFAGGDRSDRTRLLKQQASGVIETLETAIKLPFGQSYPQNLPEAGRPFEPVGPGRRKTQTALPLRQTLLHGLCELLEQSVGHNQRAQAGKI